MSGLLLETVLSVCTCWFHNTVTLSPWLVSSDSAHVHTGVFCPTVPLFPCICCSVAVHTLYRVYLCTVLLPVLAMLTLCGLLSHQTVGKVCTCYLSLCSIFLPHNILFVAPGLVLPLFHFQFLLLSLASIDRSYYYYYYYYYYVRNFRMYFQARLYIIIL